MRLQPLALAALVALAACAQPAPSGPKVTLLTINDVYRIEGVDGGAVGGLARLKALRDEELEQDPDLIVLHAGDFLFPSLLSRVYDGEQMVEVLNLIDGDPAAFDSRFFITFGNHEFDKSALKDAPMLDARIEDRSSPGWWPMSISCPATTACRWSPPPTSRPIAWCRRTA